MVLLPMWPCWKTLGLVEVQGGRKGTMTRREKWGRKWKISSRRRSKKGSWAEMHGDSDHLEEEQVVTASFLVTCWQVEGGNRMLEVRDPFFSLQSWNTEALEGPEDKDTRGPKALLQGIQGSPGHILTLNLPFTFPQPLHMATALGHQKTVLQIMKIQRRRTQIRRSFISSFIPFKFFVTFSDPYTITTVPHLLF